MKPIIRLIIFLSVFLNVNKVSAQCDSIALANDSLQWVVEGMTGSPSVGGTYRLLSSIKKYKDTLYLGGGFDYVGKYTGSCIGFDTSSGDYVNEAKWPRVNGIVKNVIDDDNNGVIIVGKFTKVGDSIRNNVVHVDSSGKVTSFKANANDTVYTALVHNGKVYIGGMFSTVNGTTRYGAAALSFPNGALDNNWNPNVSSSNGNLPGYVYSIETDGSNIYLGGTFSGIGNANNSNSLAAVNMSTGALTSFNPAVNYLVKVLKIYNGRLYIAGYFNTVAGSSRKSLASFNVNTGALDSWNPNVTFGNISAHILSMDIVDNKVYIAGRMSKVGNTTRYHIAAIDTGTAAPTSWYPIILGTELPGYGKFNGMLIRSIKLSGKRAYICGRFTRVLESSSPSVLVDRLHFAALDTATGKPTNLVINGYYNTNTDSNYTHANCVNVVDGKLYIGGKFGSFGGHQRRRFAAIDLVNNKVLESFNPTIKQGWSYVHKIDVADDTVYALGEFTDSIDGNYRPKFVAFDISNNYSVTSLQIQRTLNNFKVIGDYIYGVGNFKFTQSGNTHECAVRYNKGTGVLDNNWAPNFDISSSGGNAQDIVLLDSIVAMSGWFSSGKFFMTYNYKQSQSNNKLITSGSTYTLAANKDRVFLAGDIPNGAMSLDTTTNFNWPYEWSTHSNWNPDIGFVTGTFIDEGVHAIESVKNRVYMGGVFDTAGSVLVDNFAVVDTANGTLLPWRSSFKAKYHFGTPANIRYVRDIEVSGDTVFVAGDFNDVNGTNMAGLARFHYDNYIEPTVAISADDTSVCAGTSVTLTANVNVSGVTYKWKKNDTTQSATSSTYSFTPNDGDTVVCEISISSSGCVLYTTAESNKLIFDVTASTAGTLSLMVSSDTVCTGDSVHFITNTNFSTADYEWRVGMTNVGANIDTFSYVPANGDTVYCTAVSTSGCFAPDSVVADTIIVVKADTVTNVSIAVSTNPFCPGDDDTLTASANVTPASYQWRRNGNNITGATASTYTYAPANNDVISCIVKATGSGCYEPDHDTSTTLTLTAITPDTAKISITASSNPVPCAGLLDTFTATANISTGVTYRWKVNGNTAGANNTTYSYAPANGDIVTCDIIVPASGCYVKDTTTSSSVTVAVTQPPSITNQPADLALTDGSNAQFSIVATGSGLSYQWQTDNGSGFNNITNGGQYSGATTDVLTITSITQSNNNQKFRCIVSVGVCPVTSDEADLMVNPVSVENINYPDVKVYPNPVTNVLTVISSDNINKLDVINLVGKKIYSQVHNVKELEIDMSSYPAGIYIVKVNNASVVRIVKK